MRITFQVAVRVGVQFTGINVDDCIMNFLRIMKYDDRYSEGLIKNEISHIKYKNNDKQIRHI